MNADDIFNPGTSSDIMPEGDVARQAVDSLRGYAYQTIAAALAWLDIGERDRLFLEVAEDYATIAGQALRAVQVKDTKGSGTVTLNSANIREAVAAFVDLVDRNPDIRVEFRYFTTSDIGTEKAKADRIAGLKYWRKVAQGADITPLRTVLESEKFHKSVRTFCKARDDATLRRDLIQRIQWDCGRPDLSTINQELEERLIVIGRDRFNLPAPEARRLADLLAFKVLKKSIVKTPLERVLKRADLYAAIDGATQVSVPRKNIDLLMRLSSDFAVSTFDPQYPGKTLSTKKASWIINGAELPVPMGMIPRNDLEFATTNSLLDFGACVLVGGSGLGKTNISRTVARMHGGLYNIVNFRDIEANESQHRLDMVFAHIGGMSSSLLILEDLNYIDDTHVLSSLGRVIEALRRRDRTVAITCYRKPSARVLSDIGLDHSCVVDCPYFTEKETHALVHVNGGDPKKWGRLAYVAGAGGHPQLTHAFVFGMAAREWPAEEIHKTVIRGLSSDDIDAARDAARRNLVSVLSEGSRNILYRISLATGRFTRSLLLAIGALTPPIPRAGECLDQLLGPWIETIGKNQYRVSPLARNFGCEMLTKNEQTRIHEAIAVQMLSQPKIDASAADSIFFHAFAGKSQKCLMMIAQSILTTDDSTLRILAEHFIVFPLLKTDRLIFPDNPSVSVMLRLAQFKLAVATGDGEKISGIAAALFDEISTVPEGELRRASETLVLPTVLNTMGIANYLDNWVDLLQRFKTIVESDNFLQGLKANVEKIPDAAEANFYGSLFGIGSANISSVERLEHVINELDKLDKSERALWLSPVDRSLSDYSVFINSPWVLQHGNDDFNAVNAALSYQRMARKVQDWGIRPLTIRCWVAQAIMLDEFQNDKKEALAILNKAEEILGADVSLERARAKIYWRADQDTMALNILRGIADQVGGDNSVERAFALREAAISAGKCDEWSQAEKWFLEAQSAAKLVQTEGMHVMAVGLGADAAVAAVQIGDVDIALTRLKEAIEALAGINPDTSLCSAYCHHAIRHAILWTQSHIEGRNVEIAGKPILMEAGACSNPDPLPAVRDRPLGTIDVAWYMLAQTETAAGLDVGITARLSDRLAQGPIPVMEISLRMELIQKDIINLDAGRFSMRLTTYVEAATYLHKERDRLRNNFDPLAPKRGQIPELDITTPFDPVPKQSATDAILAFGMRAAFSERPNAIMELKKALKVEFSEDFPGKKVFDYWDNNRTTSLLPLDQTIIDTIKTLFQNNYIVPLEFWKAGLRLFEKINQSTFRGPLTSYLAEWQRAGWKRIKTAEAFHLTMPFQTVPAIDAVLAMPEDDRSFVAKLLLVTSEAVGTSLGQELRDSLKTMAEERLPLNSGNNKFISPQAEEKR